MTHESFEFKNDSGNFVVTTEEEVPKEIKMMRWFGKWGPLKTYIMENVQKVGDVVKIICPDKAAAKALRSSVSNWNSARSRSRPGYIFPEGVRATTYAAPVNSSAEGPTFVWIEAVETTKED